MQVINLFFQMEIKLCHRIIKPPGTGGHISRMIKIFFRDYFRINIVDLYHALIDNLRGFDETAAVIVVAISVRVGSVVAVRDASVSPIVVPIAAAIATEHTRFFTALNHGDL